MSELKALYSYQQCVCERTAVCMSWSCCCVLTVIGVKERGFLYAACSICYDLEGASSKLMMLDSGCCAPPVDAPPLLCDIEDEEVEERERRRQEEGRSGCVSVLISSSSSSSSSSMLGQADWSSTRFRR
ncbi:hypothetical protein F7725_000423, partial [Dissostichus mawsoni]